MCGQDNALSALCVVCDFEMVALTGSGSFQYFKISICYTGNKFNTIFLYWSDIPAVILLDRFSENSPLSPHLKKMQMRERVYVVCVCVCVCVF